MTYSTLIYGAGQIAAGYDSPASGSILTHAHAITSHDDFHLIGFYDINSQSSKKAAGKWGGRAFEVPVYADIAVICTPDEAHLDSVRQAALFSPKLIVLEKPIARTAEDVRLILEASKGIPVQVNFTRRFVCEFQALAQKIPEYGAFLTGTGLYGKGFIHNGSHMLDLLRLLVGEVESVRLLSEFSDFYTDDKTKTCLLRFTSGEFFMRGVDCRHYTVFELDLCFERARVQILDGGKLIKIWKPAHSKEYEGYVNLAQEDEMITGMDGAMYNLYENVARHLKIGDKLLSPIEGAIVWEIFNI